MQQAVWSALNASTCLRKLRRLTAVDRRHVTDDDGKAHVAKIRCVKGSGQPLMWSDTQHQQETMNFGTLKGWSPGGEAIVRPRVD
jgi:hypothetical protein